MSHRQLVKHARVGALPLSLFYCENAQQPPPTHLVRFSVCKVRVKRRPDSGHVPVSTSRAGCADNSVCLQPHRCLQPLVTAIQVVARGRLNDCAESLRCIMTAQLCRRQCHTRPQTRTPQIAAFIIPPPPPRPCHISSAARRHVVSRSLISKLLLIAFFLYEIRREKVVVCDVESGVPPVGRQVQHMPGLKHASE